MRKLRQLYHTHSPVPPIKTLIAHNQYSLALKSSLHSPLLTDQIYGLFIKSGHSLHPSLSTTLISHFAKLNNPLRALTFFLDTKCPDVIAYNALIAAFSKSDNLRYCFQLFNELRHAGLVPDVFTLSSLVRGCQGLRDNSSAHAVCVKSGLSFRVYVVSGLIENYARNGDVGSAERCFRECLDVDNVVYSVMVSGYVWNGEFEKGKEVFVEMRSSGVELNEYSFTGILGALYDIREGMQIHGVGVKMGLLCGNSLHLNNAVMSMYTRCGRKMDAVKLFDEIADPDVVSWSERIGAAHDGEEALTLFRSLHSRDLEINEYTLTNVLSTIGGVRLLNAGKQIQALCQKVGYFEAVSVGNVLVSMYGKYGKISDASRIFDFMIFRDSISWNSLLSVYSENGFANEALEVFSQICDMSIQPTVHTLASILEVVSIFNSAKQAMQIHSLAVKWGFLLDDSIVSSLITTYGRCSSMDASKRIFTEVDEISLVHINAMIATSVHAGCHADALALFQSTWASNREVDSTTFSIILKTCAAMTDMERGRAVHSLVLRTGFHQDSFVESAVVDVYCKCGSIGDAEKAFRSVSVDNLAAWNAMITGYAQHGCSEEVLKLFDELCRYAIEPDEITYLALLASCCHAGLVKEARYHLNAMFELHGITPCLEHYACMVDLLGRVGLLEDAKNTIDRMPLKPDAHIWQILLSACNIHGYVELGRTAANKLLELKPESESTYILLSNLYASAGMWNDVRKLRKEMREKVLRKQPGSSWIQVGGLIHNFLVNDTLHPRGEEIYVWLSSLYKQMMASAELEQEGAFVSIYGL